MHGPEILVPIVMFIGFFSMMIILGYISRMSKHRERMALIQNGKDASIFQEKSKEENIHSNLKWGMVALFGGMGLLVGSVLDGLGWQPPVSYFAPLLIFSGAALIGYYFLIQAKRKKEGNEENDGIV